MIFQDSFITDEGSELLNRATASEGVIQWGQAATSSLDCESKTDTQMREITTATFGTLTSLGAVTSSLVETDIANNNESVVSIHCELTNEDYHGVAKTFGVWAKVEGDASEVLAIVARCGSGVTPTTINDYSYGLEKILADLSISLTDHQSQYIPVVAGYYASAAALQDTNEEVEELNLAVADLNTSVTNLSTELSNYYKKQYKTIWDAMLKSKNNDRFSIIQEVSGPEVKIDSIDGDTFGTSHVDITGVKDGYLFLWYGKVEDGTTPANVCILSLKELRERAVNDRTATSVFNNTTMLGPEFSPYEGGATCNPRFIGKIGTRYRVLYPVGDMAPISNYYVVTRKNLLNDSRTFELTGTYTFSGFSGTTPSALSGFSFYELMLNNSGETVAVYYKSEPSEFAYVLNPTFSVVAGSGSSGYIYIDYYDRIAKKSSTSFLKMGKCGSMYWGFDADSHLYVLNNVAGDYIFSKVVDENSNDLQPESWPIHYNAILFTARQENDYSVYGMYSLIETGYNPAKAKRYTENLYCDGADSDGFLWRGNSVTLTGMYPLYNYNDSASLLSSKYDFGYLFYSGLESIEGGYNPYRIILRPVPGNYSTCINVNGVILPMLQ